jgi:Protein of unknown function (DUF4240)
MDDDRFWTIIQECHTASAGDMEQKDQLLKAAIGRLSRKEAVVFYHIFERMMDTAYTWPLWGAAYVVNGGCGDDSFSDFRASLISRGKVAFSKAMADPDSLADEVIDLERWFHEGFEYAITDAVEAKIGKRPCRVGPVLSTPLGSPWAEGAVRERYPGLVQKLRSC